MARVAAIEISNSEARVLVAESNNFQLVFTNYFTLPFDQENNLPKQPNPELNLALSDIDHSLAVLNSPQIIYREISLPFNDEKKIERTAPLQLQDQLPVDIDSFTLDSIVLGDATNGLYRILTAAAPSDSIAKTLEVSALLGLDPQTITTKASSISLLKSQFSKQLHGTFAILEASKENFSIAIFSEDTLVFIREIYSAYNAEKISPSALTEINCCLAKFNIDHVNVIANPEIFLMLSKNPTLNIAELDISKMVVNRTTRDLKIEDISWALGLLSNELLDQKNRLPIVDFRVGNFASRHLIKNLLSSLREEAVFIALAIFCAIFWLSTQYYRTAVDLNRVDESVYKIATTAASDISIPKRNELSTLEEKLVELEEQLKGMGSLSSLSPLESLLELSKTISQDIVIDIDTLNIAESKIVFRGSVADNPTVGRLSTALENNNKVFCSVKVDPSGRVPGSSRVRFSAEVELCD